MGVKGNWDIARQSETPAADHRGCSGEKAARAWAQRRRQPGPLNRGWSCGCGDGDASALGMHSDALESGRLPSPLSRPRRWFCSRGLH